MDHTSGSVVSANYLPSSNDIDDYFALFRRAIELLPTHEAAKQNAIIASIQEILDQALAAEYAQDDVLLQPSPSYLSPPLPPMTPSSAPDSPADTAYEALTPSSDATLLASPTAWGSPGETTLEKGLQLSGAVEETSNHFPGDIFDWYDFVQIPGSHDGGAALYTGTDPLLMDERPLVASGEHAMRNGEQQYGGLAAAPNDSSHSQDVGVSADTSAVTSISTALPGSGASAVPQVQQARKRKAKETSGQDEGSRPKKPKVSHACPHCSHVSTRKHNLQQHIDSKHFKLRPFKCDFEGCNDAFAREHDATRHFQSAHTDIGSPRKVKPPPKKAAKAKN